MPCCGCGCGPIRAVAFVSAKLCDVFPDGTSALITRGLLNLTHRGGYDADPVALVPGEWVDVEVELEATAWSLDDGNLLRLAIAGSDLPERDRTAQARDARDRPLGRQAWWSR